jgi:hypothetical protein
MVPNSLYSSAVCRVSERYRACMSGSGAVPGDADERAKLINDGAVALVYGRHYAWFKSVVRRSMPATALRAAIGRQ